MKGGSGRGLRAEALGLGAALEDESETEEGEGHLLPRVEGVPGTGGGGIGTQRDGGMRPWEIQEGGNPAEGEGNVATTEL